MIAVALYLAAGVAKFWACELLDRFKLGVLDRRAVTRSLFTRAGLVKPSRAWNRARLTLLAVDRLMPLLLITAIWPFVFVALMFRSVRAEFFFASHADYAFAVRTHHLGERLSIAEIESREMVFDPLNAVPSRSFGHLRAAWQAFATSAEPTSVIRAFRARQIKRGGAVLRAGYVIVNGKRRGAFFLTVYKEMDGEDGW